MTTTEVVKDRLLRARSALVFDQPFYAAILFRIPLVEDSSCPTMWTDGTQIGYNPDTVATWTDEETKGVLVHEVEHIAHLHPLRRDWRDPKDWNKACDKVVNYSVVDQAGFTLPAGAIKGVPGVAAEEAYQEDQDQSQGGQQGQQGGGQGPGAGPPQPDPAGEIRDPTDDVGAELSEGAKRQMEEDTKVMVQQAIAAAERAGNMPAGLAQKLKELYKSRVPWREILARFLDEQNEDDYSYVRPNRRFVDSEFIMPDLWSEDFGRVVLAADTSGSMLSVLEKVAGELVGGLRLYADQGTTVAIDVLWCDTEVVHEQLLDGDPIVPKGGGGTEYGPVFDHMVKHLPDARAVVYVTDGDCSDFGQAPGCPVLWILTKQKASFKPPFGELTYVLPE